MAKTAAEINAERLEAIIAADYRRRRVEARIDLDHRDLARKIVEAFPELRPHQQSMGRGGTSRTIAEPLPWATK